MKRRTNKQPAVLTQDQAHKAMAKAMLEAELQNNVRTCALANGWLFYHTHRSDRSDPGFFDCVMIRFRPSWSKEGFLWQLIFAELKREGQNPTKHQQDWLNAVAVLSVFQPIVAAGNRPIRIDQFLWKPTDWLNGTIQKELSR